MITGNSAGTVTRGWDQQRGQQFRGKKDGWYYEFTGNDLLPEDVIDPVDKPVDLGLEPKHRKTDWMDEAACASLPPRLFFAPGPTPQAAKQACAGCPVATQCLDFTRASHFGYSGRMEGDERWRTAA